MSKANWIAGGAVVFVVLAIALTFDPLGFFEGAGDDTRREVYEGDPLTATGLKGRGTRALPAADPESWEGEPVGRLVLSLGQATLEGKVTGQGEPLRFARVRPVLPPPHDHVAVRTRKDGTWEIAGLPDGQHEVRASAEEYLGRTVVAPTVAGEQTATVETIDLEPRPENKNAILVKVTDVFGAPIPGAKVLATTARWDLQLAMGIDAAGIPGVLSKSGITDENGRVRLAPMAPEEYSLVATAPGYVNASIDKLIVAAGRMRSVGLKLAEGVSVRGRVVDASGAGVDGAFVMGFAQPSFHSSLSARADANGEFVLDGLRKGPYMFVGWSDANGTAMTPGTSPGTITIKLAGAGRVKGKAVWEDGTPVASGQVRPFKIGPFQYVYSMVHKIAADGTFEFEVPDGDWNCRVQTPEGFMSDGTTVNVKVGETATVTVKVPKSAVVRGVVMDEKGNHIEGAEIFVMQGGFPESPSREQYARSDADGHFEVPGLVAGDTVDLHVQHSDYADTKIRVTPEPKDKAKELSVRMKAGAVVVGRVTDAQGNGIAGEQVNLAMGWFDARTTFTDEQGAYRFDAVTPGEYMMTTGPFEQGARGLSKSGIQIGEEGIVTENFVNPAAAGKVTGGVMQAGAPVPGAQLTLTDARGPEKAVSVRAGDDGRFAAEGLQYGSVRIDARTPAGMVGSARVRVDEGAAAPDVTIDIGTCTVRARILDTAGQPASGCWINVELADGESEGWGRVKDNGNSDTNGVYVSDGIQPGRYVLRVNRVEFAQYVSAPFSLALGENKDLGDVRMTAGVLLTGVVRDDAGAPVEKATISLRDAQGNKVQLFSMATTGSDGRYAMHSVEPGRYTVLFEAKGHAPDERPVEITDAGGSADGTLTRGATVAVTVKDQDGTPVADARIRLIDEQGREVTRTISLANFDSGRRYTDAAGAASLADLAAGTYVVTCEKAGYVVLGSNPRATLEPGRVSTLTITLEPAP